MTEKRVSSKLDLRGPVREEQASESASPVNHIDD